MGGKILKSVVLILGLMMLFPLCGTSWGADFPNKSIELLIPYAPGGPSDTMGRALIPRLEQILKQTVIPVNKPGASGALAFSLLVRMKPDGYSIIIGSNSALNVLPNFQKVEYNPLTDITCICKLYNQSPAISVKADAPWKNFEEFLNYAKKNPKAVKYGSWGKFSSGHIAMEAIAKEKGIEWTFVPFKGDGPTVTALLGGHVDAAATAAGHVPQVKAGAFRILSMLQSYRCKVFPNAPSLPENGIKFEGKGSTETWSGMFGPKGLPRDVVKKYEEAFKEVVKSPEFLRAIDMMGLEVDFRLGEDTQKEMEEGHKYVSNLVKTLDLK